jgi:uroporphyrinogen-III synthase
LFSSLVGNRGALRIAAISQAAADAAGLGWASVHVAEQPRDQALLELAARLCKTDAW